MYEPRRKRPAREHSARLRRHRPCLPEVNAIAADGGEDALGQLRLAPEAVDGWTGWTGGRVEALEQRRLSPPLERDGEVEAYRRRHRVAHEAAHASWRWLSVVERISG